MIPAEDGQKPKGPVKFQIKLTDEQKRAKETILASRVTVLHGKAGTSKTTVAVMTALDQLFKKQCDKIYLVRANVLVEEIGFLPGKLEEKLMPLFLPIKQCIETAYKHKSMDELLAKKSIEILPLAYLQGVTIDGFCLVDEAQNLTEPQFRMILTRLGKTGRLVFTGDTDQIMLPKYQESGYHKLINLDGKLEGLSCVELTENHRDPFVQQVLQWY